ncbi:hypothetical protein M408DRAFT_331973 [Serendipita vermifera MAFF 305830]|uniref:PHD-type domain-containing protein n=1 Tax=Serendipita vermifera MAFF 305830 TaxID=933852 RepID=A0A0C2X3X3_SERVB|nr:hypothetical protein M408DRAFT_331973 [Serendipita vermifera MAFF 305830]
MAARRISIAALVDNPNDPPHDHNTSAVTPVTSVSPESPLHQSQHQQQQTQPQQPHQQHQVPPPFNHNPSSQHPRSTTFTPHPYRVPISPSHQTQVNQQLQTQQHSPIEYETQFSPSNRRDIPVTNQPISFEFYDPSDPKKSKVHQHRASAHRKGDVDYLFVNNGGSSTSGGPPASGTQAASSSGGKVKKERSKAKSGSISGPSTVTAAAGPAKPRRIGGPSKKPSRESQTSGEFSAISSAIEDSGGNSDYQAGMTSRRSLASLMNSAPTPSDHPTPASDRNSVAPSATPGPGLSPGTEPDKSPVSVDQNWTAAAAEIGAGYIPAETTVEDDIMADLEMAEQQPRKRNNVPAVPSSQPPPRPQPSSKSATNKMTHKAEEELEMELEMDLLQGLDEGLKKTTAVTQLHPDPAPKKSVSRSSIAPSPSPAPSSFTPARTPAPAPAPTAAAPTVTKKPAAKATAKPKAKAAPKKKADNTKGKGSAGNKGDSDWGWTGTSSGRAAAAAAANALLGEDGHGGRDSVPPVHSKEEENAEDDEEDDKRLYCVCRELYDNRFMLGCDNCDEWFHPPCLGMEDFQCDLLEHFYCASCRKVDPSLKTTWRIRCANGQQHPYPDTADACWKAALPPLSKYCSTECGMDAMERRIAPIVCANAGLGPAAEGELLIPRTPAVKTEMTRLWRGVKDARKRDAVVVPASQRVQSSTQSSPADIKVPPQRTDAEKLAASLIELSNELENLTNDTHMRSRELEFILARGRLARLAIQWSDKSENVTRCCFDSRILLEGAEWEEWVEGVGRAVLEGTMDASGTVGLSAHAGRAAFVDGNGNGTGEEEELRLEMDAADSPWCDGRRKCERHFGWQKLCMAEFELNKGTKELALQGLAGKERDVRTRIEQIQDLLQTMQNTRVQQQDIDAGKGTLMVGVSA